MTPPALSPRLAALGSRVWQLDATARLLAMLDERHTALRAAVGAPLAQRATLMAHLDAADTALCIARASFLDAVCQLQMQSWAQPRPLATCECRFDAFDVLLEFEAAWENALENGGVASEMLAETTQGEIHILQVKSKE